jgi:hypothetical protein
VLILKIDKALCFDTFLQVLILNSLEGRKRTKIVQNGLYLLSVTNKRLRPYNQSPENKKASRDAGATEPVVSIT